MTFYIKRLKGQREIYAEKVNLIKVHLSKSSISLHHAYFYSLLLVTIVPNGSLVKMTKQKNSNLDFM